MKHSGSKKNPATAIILIAVLIIAVIAAVVLIKQRSGKDVQHLDDGQTAVKENGYEAADSVDLEGLTNGYIISTPIGELRFPEKWKENVRTEEVGNSDDFGVAVYGEVGGREVKLFTIYVGNNQNEGHLFGTVPNKDGETVNVRIAVDAFTADDTWEKEDADEINAMQEGVNFIIQQIYELPGFEAAN